MNTETNQISLGPKIWYGVAIGLSILVILVSVALVVGTWVAGSTLSPVASQTLLVVENTAGGLSNIVERLDQQLVDLEDITTSLRDATSQVSQNVTDKGLILTLLPEESEQELVAHVDQLQQNLNSVVETLNAGLELYRSIDRLPFVSLPEPDQQTISKLERSIADARDTIGEIKIGIQDFRAGVSDNIGRVTDLLDDVTASLAEASRSLAQINSSLEAMQDLADRLGGKIQLIFTSLGIIITLFVAWLIYTQVEIMLLFIQRWKELSGSSDEGSTGADLTGPVD